MATERTKILRKVYEYADGTEGRSAKPDATALRFELLAPNKDENDNFVILETRTYTWDQISANADMNKCQSFHGFSKKVGDEIAGVAKQAVKAGVSPHADRGYVDFALEIVDDAAANILEAGVWITEKAGSGAPRVTMVAEAIGLALTEAGKAFDPARILERLRTEPDYLASAKSNPHVLSHLEALKLQRQQERAKAAAMAAGEAESGGLDGLV